MVHWPTTQIHEHLAPNLEVILGLWWLTVHIHSYKSKEDQLPITLTSCKTWGSTWRWSYWLAGYSGVFVFEGGGGEESTHTHLGACKSGLHTHTHTHTHTHNVHTHARMDGRCTHTCMHTRIHTHTLSLTGTFLLNNKWISKLCWTWKVIQKLNQCWKNARQLINTT